MSMRHYSRRRFLAAIAAGAGGAVLAEFGCSPRREARSVLANDLPQLDLSKASKALRARSVSPVELTRACLDRIYGLDQRLNSFITLSAESALAEARQAEQEIVQGRWRGPLHGIPIALKDNIDTAGVLTTAASAVFEKRVPVEDAEVVQRLKTAGAVFLGKLNMHEFALGTTSAISHYGPVHNPWDVNRIAGGSSGGCAAAVAASFCFGAVGTDTGGSIRIPAACCGVVGLKPTYGVVSARGVVPISNSFDHVGPLCHTVADTALMFRAMTDHRVAAGYNPEVPPPVSRLRIGVFQTPDKLCDGVPVEEEVRAAVDAAIEVIRPLVGEVRDANLPMPDELGLLIDAEAYAFHASHLAQTPELYDPRTRSTILQGQGISQAETARLRGNLDQHRAALQDAFSSIDVVILPTLPELPLTIQEATDPFALHACTFAFSLGGLPSISLPCGFSRSGLPIGLLLSGPPLSEPHIFALAQAYEDATAWRRRRPFLEK